MKILHVLTTTSISRGDFMVVLNYYRNMNRNNTVFDFAYINDNENNANEELKIYGSKVFKFTKPGLKTFNKTIKELRQIIKQGKYDIVHLHIPSFQYFVKKAIKKTKCKHLVIHAHSSKLSNKFINRIRNRIMIIGINKNISARFACSVLAGYAFFGKTFGHEKFDYVLNNAIDLSKFKFNKEIALEQKKQLNITENDVAVCHVGRFLKEKNHIRLLEIFKEVNKLDNRFKLFLIGDGPKRREIENKVKELNLSNSVKLLGNIDNVNKILQAMDVMIFPSLFEGLGMALIEAQAAGLLCFSSDTCPKDVEITNNIFRLSLTKSNEYWAKFIVEKYKNGWNRDTEEAINNHNYNITKVSKNLLSIYQNIKNLN